LQRAIGSSRRTARAYSVTSDYGVFAAPSDARLRRLVREIAAIAELQKVHQSDAFAKAAVEAEKGVVQGAQQLIENPVATIGAVPEGDKRGSG
jgi:hypothetical protein